jgi:hypothetical protein
MFRSSLVVLLLGGAACSVTDAGVTGTAGTGGSPSQPGATGGTTGTTTGSGGRAPGSGGTPVGSGGAKVVGTGGSGAPAGGSGGTGTNGAAYSDIPCDVATILSKSCGMCHGASPSFGAPMPLVRAADFAKMSFDGSRTVGQAVIARINDNVKPMPQVPVARLTATENSTLTTWINAGSKAAACTSVGPAPGVGIPDVMTDPTDPDVTCYDITARNTTKGKFSVPTTPDLYHCFHYSPPWGTEKVHMVHWRPLIDNDKVIHHWLLFNDTDAVADNTSVDCSGVHPAAQLVAGWAPGGRGFNLPTGVGQDVSGKGFTLETHYNNTLGSASPDASGLRVCVTKKVRPVEAGLHWLGTELILLPAGGQAAGICKPSATGPVTIMTSTPHMHLQGRHMKTVINRVNGTMETLLDKPFAFESQVGYDTPAVIMPGDYLTTTCTYGGAATFGEGTKQEMCYNFVLAYPNGGLSSGSLLRKNGCTGL